MNRTLIGSLSAVSLATLALPALAGELPPAVGNTTAIITADNHYTLYTGTDSALSFIGRNELNAGGTPGTYNWSVPETHTFNTGPKIFIAAWSDDAVAQGVLAQITGPGGTYNSGDARWEVFCTGINLGDGDASPSTALMATQIAIANAGNLWKPIYVGGNNGVAPWGTVPGIASNIPWMWTPVPGDADPLNGGSGAGEFLIFRMSVPTPGAAGVLAMGGIMGMRRRHR
jgi:hypothetical protein